MKKVAEFVVTHLLDSMFNAEGRGKTFSFMFGIDNNPWSDKRFSTELYFDESLLLDTILYLRANGPFYLRQIPPDEIRSLLFNFVSNNFIVMFDEVYFKFFEHSYGDQVSSATKEKLALTLLSSDILSPNNYLTIFPLKRVKVDKSFISSLFFIVDNDGLANVLLDESVEEYDIHRFFPQIDAAERSSRCFQSWLGVRAPSFQSADSIKRSVLGAASLTMNYNDRYMISMIDDEGGYCTITDNAISYQHKSLSTPSLMSPLIITEADFKWLRTLATLLQDNSKKAVCQSRALDYFYSSWHRNESERFPILYMSVESIFGDPGRATVAFVDAVRDVVNPNIPESRIKALSDLRAAVIHGGAAQVYDSSKYAKYYRKYKQDPVKDMALITAACLRLDVFGESLKEKEYSAAKYIQEAIKAGNMAEYNEKTILQC